MLVGYARVSTEDQDLTLQRTALSGAGCKRIYEEKVSGAKRSRPELDRMLDQLRAGDVIVVSRLDRLARSTRDLLDIAEQLKEVGAGLRSLHEPWADTTSPAGRMVLTVFAGIADYAESVVMQSPVAGLQVWPTFRRRGAPHNPNQRRVAAQTLCYHRGCPQEWNVAALGDGWAEMMFGLAPGLRSKGVGICEVQIGGCGPVTPVRSMNYDSARSAPDDKLRITTDSA